MSADDPLRMCPRRVGAGKSALLSVLAGVRAADAGTVVRRGSFTLGPVDLQVGGRVTSD